MKNVIFAIAVFLTVAMPAFANSQPKESHFDRIMRTGTLRCGYATWPPTLMKDPNSGKLSGYSYDIMNAVGEKLGLKIDWAEETGWGLAEQGILSNRFDAMCTDVCLDAARTKRVWYSMPFNHSPLYVFVRADDTRFDHDLSALNHPNMKIAVLPHAVLDYAAQDAFPAAQRLDVNDLGDNMDVIMAVTTRKADASINNLYGVEQFNKNNKTKIKIVGEPVRMCHGGFLLPQGDMNLKQMIDSAIYELNSAGILKKIYSKYQPDDNRHWHTPALPYKEKEAP